MKILRLIAIFIFTAVAWAQTAARPASITAVGQASVSASPDLARVDIGVVTQAANAQDATVQNATQAVTVIAALQGLLGPNATIKTISYSVSPVYNNPPPGQNASIVAYMVTNTVEVTLTDLTQTGKVIDTAIQSGANRVQGISFDLQERNPLVAQALKAAAARALSQANAIASGLNVHTGSVLHASESVNSPGPVFTGIAAAPTTPIQTGTIVVQASVTVEVAITQ
jgi:uncharacterized protein YggE